MENNQIIAAQIQVDTGNSGAVVSQLNKETSQLKGSLKDVGATATGTGKTVGDAGVHFGKLKGQIEGLPGPTKNLTTGLGGVNQAFNVLKANPIIGIFALIAGLVVALFEKFKKMEDVGDSLGKAWGSLSTIFSTFLNKILTPLIDAFTSFIGLFTKAASWIVGIFSPGLSEAAKRGGELAEALDDLNDAEAKSAITRAESNLKLQEARELAQDANVPIRERIQALKDAAKIEKEETENSIKIATERARAMLEQIAQELGARSQLIQAIRNGSIEQLKAARNEIFAMKNVDKKRIEAIDALIIQTKNQSSDLAKINKKTNSQITSLEKEEQQKQKEQRDKAIASQKEAEQKLQEFRTKLRQLNQDNDLNQIKDGYQRELKALELKLQNEKAANEQAVKQHKLTREQANELNIALQKANDLKVAEVTGKHNKELADKETDFQTKLAKLRQEIALGGIVDQRTLEKEQLRISHDDALKDAEKQYADDAEKLSQIKFLIDEKYRQDQKKQNEKFAEEDAKAKEDKAKKALEDSLNKEGKIVDDPNASFDTKIAAIDAEQKLLEDAFNNKLITEQNYTDRVKQLTEERIQVAQVEKDAKLAFAQSIGGSLNQLADLAGKHTKAGKALAIASIIAEQVSSVGKIVMNTQVANAKSIAQFPLTGGMPWVAINTAQGVIGAAASIAAGVKAINALGGSGGTGASAPNLSPSAPLSPTVNTTKIDADSINNLGNAAAGGVNRNMRAYVVNSDIKNETERDARISRAAVLGGGG